MLTLDGEQLERQRQRTDFLAQQYKQREALWDALEKKTSTVANDGDLVTTDLESQIGKPLHHLEFIKKLSKMNPYLVIEPAYTFDVNRLGIYRPIPGTAEKQYLSSFQKGWLPERSVRHVKTTRNPDPDPMNSGGWIETEEFKKETRGWRTVLVRLLRAKAITIPQIIQQFPLTDGRSKNWQTLTGGTV